MASVPMRPAPTDPIHDWCSPVSEVAARRRPQERPESPFVLCGELSALFETPNTLSHTTRDSTSRGRTFNMGRVGVDVSILFPSME